MRIARLVLALAASTLPLLVGCSDDDRTIQPPPPPVADGPCDDDTGNRFVDCGNGTVTDTATGLLWLKDFVPGPGWQTWDDAMASAGWMCDGMGALHDHSSAGSWRLPTRAEWAGILKRGCYPSLPDRSGTGCFADDPWRSGTAEGLLWTSETAALPTAAWLADVRNCGIIADDKSAFHEFWLVRGP